MSKHINLTAALLAAGLVTAVSQPATAGFYAPAMMDALAPTALVQQVHARSYHHCHNMPRRIRCHKSQRLPVNWPPNTDTPGRSSSGKRHVDGTGTCSNRDRKGRCWH